MFPPLPFAHVDLEAFSEICGSISIACWVVVFSPQIIENFRRGSADGLSLLFLIIWLAGDVFNILGSVLQGVLPTMIILAVYYTLADIVLLGQCFYYRGFSLLEGPSQGTGIAEEATAVEEVTGDGVSEETPLLYRDPAPSHFHQQLSRPRRASLASFRERLSSLDGTHLSPAVPLIDPSPPSASVSQRTRSTLQIFAFNAFSVALVCAAGVLGWYVSIRWTSHTEGAKHHTPKVHHGLEFNVLGQAFGYLCAALYLSSRVPQILLNWRRKSTEGVSLLFFLFACIGNLTYVFSIFAYSPVCDGGCQPGEQRRIYGRYILVNASWILGSLGTLLLDISIFVQFILYRAKNKLEEVSGYGGIVT